MADKFFEEPVEETPQEPETIKLGEKEYSQEDLSRLVGLGEIAAEAEEKYKTKIDRVWPEYTKATQKMSDYERKIEELQSKIDQPANTQTETTQLTAEQKEIVKKQLEDLGMGTETFRNIVREELAAKELSDGVGTLISEMKEAGNPATTQAELLQHMVDTGIKNPVKAYKDMFESELDAIKEKKLAEIKPAGMVTTTGSQAGSKQPAAVKLPKNRDELTKMVQEALNS